MNKGTPLGRVRGHGSAKHGAHHWLLQRFTAAGNLLLTGFFAVSLMLMADFSYETLTTWIAGPIPATAMALLVISTFWHAKLGLQVLIEDYLYDPATKFAAVFALNLAAFGGAAFGVFSILRLALGGAA